MLNIVKKIENVDFFDKDNIKVIVAFETILSNGERVYLTADYDKDGKMVACMSASSRCNAARYYIEIAEVFQAMVDLEGEKAKDIVAQAIKYNEEYDAKIDALNKNEEVKQIRNNYWDLKATLDELNLKYDRARTEKSKEKITKDLESVKEHYEEVTKQFEECYRDKITTYSKEFNKQFKSIVVL